MKKGTEVVGVLTVDCLEYQLKPEQLREIFVRLLKYAAATADVLSGLPTDRIAILSFT